MLSMTQVSGEILAGEAPGLEPEQFVTTLFNSMVGLSRMTLFDQDGAKVGYVATNAQNLPLVGLDFRAQMLPYNVI